MSESPGVLIVDADAEFRATLAETLEEEGYVVFRAPNGARAVEILSACRPWVVVFDLKLPLLDGRELLQIVRSTKATADLPMILISEEVTDLPLGLHSHLRKPLNVDKLLTMLGAMRAARSPAA